MDNVSTLVLPGLDGTTPMLSDFRESAPSTLTVTPLELPSNLSTYVSLLDHCEDRLATTDDLILVAESFSGPLAVMLASRHPHSIRALVLVASFVTSPLPLFARLIPWSLFLRVRLPSLVVRRFMLGRDCTASQINELQSAIQSVPVRTLSGRIRELMRIDVSETFASLTCPVVYLQATRDLLIPQRCVDTIVRKRPDTSVHSVDGAHLILETQSNEAWRIILSTVALPTSR